MKFFAIFTIIFAIVIAVVSSAAFNEHAQLGDCSNDACRASCILNGHNGGSCNSNDNCDCN
ncbi:hypothetical protein NQ317_010147 [Molorchus minor]|uniref:Defensin n=1 Tax=Molorchus minor TaxID=1323400 RepID=A0ABQ9JG09_9CUCU|nr:hypothetical protein NQ317_010147 [Molorchus minor]